MEKILKLFNGVIKDNNEEGYNEPFISENGFIIEPSALWAKETIINFWEKEYLNGNDLNKTFHKSWKKIKESSRCELLIDQIKHYISTYGSNFEDEIYIPDEVSEIPDVNIVFKVIKGYSKEEIKDKCLSLLKSGIALKEETIDDIIRILTDDLDYSFTGDEDIRNKEAIIKIADMYNVYPKDVLEFFRYIVYKSTNQTLLIKNDEIINRIKNSVFNPSIHFKKYGLEKLSTIFNRFKPLFLAFKDKCPKTINKISKLSKKFHKPMVENPLNNVTNKKLSVESLHWLDNASVYALFKALSACHNRINNQDTFMYRIRNGKIWVEEKDNSFKNVVSYNYQEILKKLKERVDFSNLKFYIPDNIEYALPTSEKMYIGNIPIGTKIIGNKLVFGIYWEDKWGARDLDLSALNIGGKIGWDSSYKDRGDNIYFSGDITSAPNGAVEYLHANKSLTTPTLIFNNIYNGSVGAQFKILVGDGHNINKNYMMDPNNLIIDVRSDAVSVDSILGMFLPTDDNRQSVVIMNFGYGNSKVSHNNETNDKAMKAIFQEWNNPLTFNKIIRELGGEITNDVEDCDYDFSIGKLEKDSFTGLF